ncbi:maltose ABC transporter permease MalF [Parachitinimonas caeni]|uniref:Maltose/maltodextrin transport system permease protein n=1 Tax=Parachitinimonas caeni TaxID=3031301 RepID=A0ABT7DV49_9NEIS|nr:maltose ABC transporter permease MalF [Parachitinimonas caeni]MDK2123945.1 maltose ABC transporter permease MalF [Parachitinimonas caeni]
MRRNLGRVWQPLLAVISALFGLYMVMKIYVAGQPSLALGCMAVLGIGIYVYTSGRAYAYRYLFPGMLAAAVFVLLPLIYTFAIGFTNYSSKNLLSYERARQYFLEETYQVEGDSYAFSLHDDGNAYRIRLERPDGKVFATAPLALKKPEPLTVEAKELAKTDAALSATELQTPQLVPLLPALKKVTVTLPDTQQATLSGLREFAPVRLLYKANADGSLTNQQDGTVIRADQQTGFFTKANGEALQPGFKVGVGFDNYKRIFTEPTFREPFIRIFIWTVAFAGLTVVFTFAVGVVLAVLLNWEALRFRAFYRVMLFLPYAVPGFISILVFKGLFSENSGEINAMLKALFGISPHWFSDPWLARSMLLIVNTWLGYPYMMVLCMGLIKAIPSDLYEASAIAGAGPLTNFFKITLPLIAKPITPLLISAFAFNFNNFVLIALLTGGRPDFIDTTVPAGETDLLVSYTYRIAFEDSGQQFGLAAAISTVIFIMVAILSIVNLRLTKVNQQEAR